MTPDITIDDHQGWSLLISAVAVSLIMGTETVATPNYIVFIEVFIKNEVIYFVCAMELLNFILFLVHSTTVFNQLGIKV